ncbi:MAG: YedE-related selenium metabolism membrane protein [Oscillospiraceae bacterium]|nr:YedE-related selenium metabolism membrane protein [Oscillospiraceae bacterium]
MSKKINPLVLISGLAVGVAALLLTALGNPANMGFCIACFIRDIAGATQLHTAAPVQYFRPEIVGLVLGSTVMALATKEFKPRAGSSPATRFIVGAFVMIGALVFLGCPLRMVIRMGGGDLNAFVGLLGFFLGILIGVFFLKKDFTLKRTYEVTTTDGLALPGLLAVLFVIFLAVPALFVFSESGPGSKHAPMAVSLLVALVVGALAQKSRLCMVGGMRDAVMFKDFNLLSGFGAIFVTVLLGNVILGKFGGFSTLSQPIAHSSELWNLLGMVLVGWGSVLLGGCPLRQLILAGEGNGDSTVTVLGMLVGAAFAHNFKLAGGADSVVDGVYKVGGIGANGKAAVCIGFAVLLVISLMNCSMLKKEAN